MAPKKAPKPFGQPIDREKFLRESNALLRRVELISFLMLAIGSLMLLFYSRIFGLSLLIGGCMGIAHFRSLHRMFQKRTIHPEDKEKSQFLYGLTLFFIVGVFFWAIDRVMLDTAVVIAGFFLTTGSVLLESRLGD